MSLTHSSNTDVFTYRIQASDPRKQVLIVAKAFRGQHELNATQLRYEYQALRRIESQLGSDLADSVPHALLFLEEDATLFTTPVEGANFSKLLRRKANLLSGWMELRATKDLQRCGHGIGEWLRRFQESTSSSPTLHNHEVFMQHLCMGLDRCVTSGLPRDLAGKLKVAIGDLSRSLSDTLIATAAVHGDFLPQNILIQDQHVHIVDFGNFRPAGPIYIDPSQFLGYLLILSRKPAYCRNALKDVAAHFRSGYHAELHAGVLLLYTTKAVLRILLDSDLTHRAIALTVLEQLLSAVSNKRYLVRLGTEHQ